MTVEKHAWSKPGDPMPKTDFFQDQFGAYRANDYIPDENGVPNGRLRDATPKEIAENFS